MHRIIISIIAASVATTAHAGWIADAGYDTGLRGGIAFEDASTDLDGLDCPPARPLADMMSVSLELEGAATWDGLRPECRFVSAGDVSGVYEGEGEIREDGTYLAAFGASDASFMAEVGCALDDPELTVVTGATLRVELTPTIPQCEAYCAASARNAAEGLCGADADAAGCRLDAEGAAEAECMVACTEEAYAIVGEAELGAGTMARMNSGLEGAGWGVARTRVKVDHLEDADGEPIAH